MKWCWLSTYSVLTIRNHGAPHFERSCCIVQHTGSRWWTILLLLHRSHMHCPRAYKNWKTPLRDLNIFGLFGLFLLHLLIDLTCSPTVRSHHKDPPRSFNWSVTNLFHAIPRLSLNTTVSPPLRLASDWCVPTLFQRRATRKPAVCGEYISGEKPPVRHAFCPLYRVLVVAVHFPVKMSQDVMGCCSAIAS